MIRSRPLDESPGHLRLPAPMVEAAVVTTFAGFKQLWRALFPAEEARIIQLLVARITVSTNGIAVDLRKEGLGLLLRDMLLPAKEDAFA